MEEREREGEKREKNNQVTKVGNKKSCKKKKLVQVEGDSKID